jgi:hypothetical protein
MCGILEKIVESYDDNEDQCNIDTCCLLNLLVQSYPSLPGLERFVQFLYQVILQNKVLSLLFFVFTL